MHRGKKESIGSNAERLVENAPTNVLITSTTNTSSPTLISTKSFQEKKFHEKLIWTEDAKKHLDNIPGFARPMAILSIERYAREQGITLITLEVMRNARENK